MSSKTKQNDVDQLIRTTIGQFKGSETDEDLRYVTDKWLELKKYQYGDWVNSSISLLALFAAVIAILIATHSLSNIEFLVVLVAASSLFFVYLANTRNFPKETDKALRTYIELRKAHTTS